MSRMSYLREARNFLSARHVAIKTACTKDFCPLPDFQVIKSLGVV